MQKIEFTAYELSPAHTEEAAARGLVGALWYQTPIARADMKALMQRHDRRALLDTGLWLGLVAATGVLAAYSWGTSWAWLAFFVYGALYAGPADSRWHETGHGTAFKTPWMNKSLYQLASFMVLRRPTVWRWSHARHHSDTLVRGRDPEITFKTPPAFGKMAINLLSLQNGTSEWAKVVQNALGRIDPAEKSFIPEMELPKLATEARVWLVVALSVIGLALYLQSWLPLLLVGLPSFYGSWLYQFFGATQHAGLPENVLDHRLNCRTVYMNPVFRFLYWNMNYHLEHHMYPMVPYHALPRLHRIMQADCPPVYPSTWAAYREIVPAIRRQAKDPEYFIKRPLPKETRI